MRKRVVTAALADPEHSPRELAWQLTDRTGHFLSESSVYRIRKAADLITSPAFIVLQAADRFAHKSIFAPRAAPASSIDTMTAMDDHPVMNHD